MGMRMIVRIEVLREENASFNKSIKGEITTVAAETVSDETMRGLLRELVNLVEEKYGYDEPEDEDEDEDEDDGPYEYESEEA